MKLNFSQHLCKLKCCTEATQTLPFKSLQNNFLHSRPLHGANISQIFSFTRTASSHNIQLVPNIQNTSFHIPVKSSIEPRAVVATIQFVPKYESKVKVKDSWLLRPFSAGLILLEFLRSSCRLHHFAEVLSCLTHRRNF